MIDYVSAKERLTFPSPKKWWERIAWEIVAITSTYFLLIQLTSALGA